MRWYESMARVISFFDSCSKIAVRFSRLNDSYGYIICNHTNRLQDQPLLLPIHSFMRRKYFEVGHEENLLRTVMS